MCNYLIGTDLIAADVLDDLYAMRDQQARQQVSDAPARIWTFLKDHSTLLLGALAIAGLWMLFHESRDVQVRAYEEGPPVKPQAPHPSYATLKRTYGYIGASPAMRESALRLRAARAEEAEAQKEKHMQALLKSIPKKRTIEDAKGVIRRRAAERRAQRG